MLGDRRRRPGWRRRRRRREDARWAYETRAARFALGASSNDVKTMCCRLVLFQYFCNIEHIHKCWLLNFDLGSRERVCGEALRSVVDADV